jgi:DNA-binding GntR family transcriptional regulator
VTRTEVVDNCRLVYTGKLGVECIQAATEGKGAGVDASGSGKATQLYERLRNDLITGRLSPGQRLSEASLGREYGVSRSPIREATARLEHDGLIERQGLVVRVRHRTVNEIVDIYRVRVFLESAIAADAAARRYDVDLLRLDRAFHAEEEIDQTDRVAVVEANRAFHDALAAAAHNVTLQDLQQRLTAQIATLPATTLSHAGRWEQAHEEHKQVLEAVRARDVEAARSVAEQHMSRARDLRVALFAEEPS